MRVIRQNGVKDDDDGFVCHAYMSACFKFYVCEYFVCINVLANQVAFFHSSGVPSQG